MILSAYVLGIIQDVARLQALAIISFAVASNLPLLVNSHTEFIIATDTTKH